ncbi:hypothetical protein SDC9_95366 [bioreactor metagenome]|uniref:Uncharacterized protein n=1 Tax=bioreactor metagenome TaxID=1076179 RepID=A0A645A639_9ZZZZ
MVILELMVKITVLRDDRFGNGREVAVRNAKLRGKANRAPDEPAQDVALIHVARRNAALVAQHERCAPDMVGNDSEHARNFLVLAVLLAGELRNLADDAGERVRVVHALDALQSGDRAVETHAGIDVFLFERDELALRGLLVFHKDVVPDFQILAAVAAGFAVRAAGRFAGIVEDLRIRSAGAGQPGGAPPVVFLRQVYDVAGRNAVGNPAVMRNGIARGVLVAFEAGEIQQVRVNAEPFLAGEELPGERDGFLFKVIAQRPVAEHLKERAVRRIADLIDIASADALLHVDQARSFGMLCSH